jgi:iduronate 2-sulfatase
MSGYYPHATGVQGYTNPRTAIGDRATWSQHFKNGDYYTARVSKIFHMGVPGGIEEGSHGADDELSWTERFNSQRPEWKAAGVGETLEQNLDGKKPVMGGNTFVVVAAEGDDIQYGEDGPLTTVDRQKGVQSGVQSWVSPSVPLLPPSHFPIPAFVRGDRLEPDSGPLRTPASKSRFLHIRLTVSIYPVRQLVPLNT